MVSGRCEDQKENSLSHANRKKHKTIIIKYFIITQFFLSDILSPFWFNQITANSLYVE
jgi:hypothetical protein